MRDVYKAWMVGAILTLLSCMVMLIGYTQMLEETKRTIALREAVTTLQRRVDAEHERVSGQVASINQSFRLITETNKLITDVANQEHTDFTGMMKLIDGQSDRIGRLISLQEDSRK